MNTLEQKIKELIGDVNTSTEEFDFYYEKFVSQKMKLIARYVFNELYPFEATGEVEPWATPEQREGQETFSNGWNEARKRVREKAELLGIIKPLKDDETTQT